MNIQKHIRTVVMAALVSMAVAGVPVVQYAHAQPYTPRGSYPPCAYFNTTTGEWEFYGPGDSVYAKDGNGRLHRLDCIQGQWQDGGVVAAVVSPSSGIQAPLPIASALGS